MLWLYRNHFNAVDVYNKMAVGPSSLQSVVGTKLWWKRVFISFLGLCETNAYLAYCRLVRQVSRYDFRAELAATMLRVGGFEPMYISITDSKSHRFMTSFGEGLKRVCARCKTRTKQACECGVALCAPTTGRTCFHDHIMKIGDKQGK